MRAGLIAGLLATAAGAQNLVNPERLPSALRTFEPRPDESKLTCRVRPLKPSLNFGFRFQAGFVVTVPMKNYAGPRHRWTVLTRVTPAGGGKPAYLSSMLRVPQVPQTNVELEVSGTYLLGEGRYDAQFQMVDEGGRVCRANWKLEARLSRGDRKIHVAIPPGTVSDVAGRGLPRAVMHDDAPPFRLTLMVNAAPAITRRLQRMSARDRMLLLGYVGSLFERLPATSIRLVVFSLDKQKELFRQDGAKPETLFQMQQSLNELELGLVELQTLQNKRGHLDLVADLVNRELAEPVQSDVVLFLGPPSRFYDRVPEETLTSVKGPTPNFFYLQYRQPMWRESPFGDSISSAVSRMHGKTRVVRTPGDFAKAIEEVERRVEQTASLGKER
jgi:hypothetical protein